MKRIFASVLSVLFSGSLLLISARQTVDKTNDTFLQTGLKAVAAIATRRSESLNGYFMVYCKVDDWKSLQKDGDLGPFLKFEGNTKDLVAIVATPSKPDLDSTYCVYFRNGKPLVFVEVKTGKGEKVNDQTIRKGFVVADEAMNNAKAPDVKLEMGTVYSDDNKPIPSFKIIDDGKNNME